jgi:hypothetical protein
MIVIMIQREELMSVQYWKRTQMAEISVGMERRLPYTMFQLYFSG